MLVFLASGPQEICLLRYQKQSNFWRARCTGRLGSGGQVAARVAVAQAGENLVANGARAGGYVIDCMLG